MGITIVMNGLKHVKNLLVFVRLHYFCSCKNGRSTNSSQYRNDFQGVAGFVTEGIMMVICTRSVAGYRATYFKIPHSKELTSGFVTEGIMMVICTRSVAGYRATYFKIPHSKELTSGFVTEGKMLVIYALSLWLRMGNRFTITSQYRAEFINH